MSSLARRRSARLGSRAQTTMAALDIGCSKIACLIARERTNLLDPFEFVGGGRQQSRGFEGGVITDLEGLERSIRLAVEDAEREGGERVERITLGVTSPRLECLLTRADLNVSGRPITGKDIRRLQAAAVQAIAHKDFQILTAHPIGFRLDDQDGVRDPRGMYGDQLTIMVSVVRAPASLIRNLLECVGRAHLDVERIVPSAVASAYGVLIEDERENGAICIDLGGGVTTACVFLNGAPAWLAFVPAGGRHVTGDIAQGLGTTFAAAERVKTVYGMADPTAPGHAERIECPKLGDDGRLRASRMSRSELAEIIAPRLAEILEFTVKRLEAGDLRRVLPRRIVLTGGGSQIPGLKEVASRLLGMPVRLARPVASESLGETYATPPFSTAAGLLTYKPEPQADMVLPEDSKELVDGAASLKRTLKWLKENF